MAATATKVIYRTKPKEKKKRARAKTTIPLAAVAGFVPLVLKTWQNYSATKDPTEIPGTLVSSFTGYQIKDGNFDFANLRYGLYPVVLGFAVHKLAGILGINRMLGRARVPFARL